MTRLRRLVLTGAPALESAGVGPLRMETWVYRAADGEGPFVVAGNTVVSRTTGAPSRRVSG